MTPKAKGETESRSTKAARKFLEVQMCCVDRVRSSTQQVIAVCLRQEQEQMHRLDRDKCAVMLQDDEDRYPNEHHSP